MFKKLVFSFCFICTAAYAETCPTTTDIQHNYLHGWNAFDSDNGTPLTLSGVKKFKQQVGPFSMAEWAEDAPEGEGHCYYQNNYAAQPMDAFLAKHNLEIDHASANWRYESGALRCHGTTNSCIFLENRHK